MVSDSTPIFQAIWSFLQGYSAIMAHISYDLIQRFLFNVIFERKKGKFYEFQLWLYNELANCQWEDRCFFLRLWTVQFLWPYFQWFSRHLCIFICSVVQKQSWKQRSILLLPTRSSFEPSMFATSINVTLWLLYYGNFGF